MTATGRQPRQRHRRVPRALHPIAWWLWAIGLATAVSRTTNPLLLLLVLAVLGVVVASRRGDAPWARAFKYYIYLALVGIAIRVAFRVVFGGDIDAATQHVLFTLPHVPLPSWMDGVQLGGPVTLEGTLSALYDGLRLGTMLCCLGAANVLANPKRALRVLPGALYELGVAAVVALTVAPQLVESVQRVRKARKLRGGATSGRHALRTIAIPVLEDALERSLRLAAAMDSRGYGRTGNADRRTRRATGVFMLGGMCALCAGAYGLLDDSAPGALGLPAFAVGAVLCVVGLSLGSRQVRRSQYRPDPWRFPEWVVTVSGIVPAAVLIAGAGFSAASLNPSTDPLVWPTLPIVPALAILVAAIAAVAAPPPLRSTPGPSTTTVRQPDPVGADRRSLGPHHGGGAGVIDLEHVTITYAEADAPVLRDVSLHIDEGELALVVGRTGVGKSTFLGALSGLVPHFSGGTLAGRVLVGGRETRTHKPRELADVVGVVGQDPLSGFVADTVEEELAYVMEQLAVPPGVMRKRVEETLDLLGIADLRNRSLRELSGGQQQRVAIGSVLTAQPRVLVLDEPTSALDPTAAEEVLAAITRLVHDLGVTVVLAEHRLERVVQYADRVIEVRADGRVDIGDPAAMLATTKVAPPVVELGRLAHWQPLALSVRDARRLVGPLREQMKDRVVPATRRTPGRAAGAVALRARNVVVRYGAVVAVRGVDLDLRAGEITAVMGRNGSGKSSLLWALQGSGPRQGGVVAVAGNDPKALSPAKARSLVGLVPQTPADLLYLETVADELAQADREAAEAPSVGARVLLDRLAPGIPDDVHPRDLSEGQRLALVLAVQLAAAPDVVLLDEPTRGLDYSAKRSLIEIVDFLAAEGHSVVVATHDVEFVAAAADRVVVMAEGDVVADGPTADVVVASPAFAPQVAKILAPLEYLTIEQVRDALAELA